MRNKLFIQFWIWLAFTIVLGHNIVPHHHHNSSEEQNISNPAQHEGDDMLADILGHFFHSPNTHSVTFQNADHADKIYSVINEQTEAALPLEIHSPGISFCWLKPQFIPERFAETLHPYLSDHLAPRAPPAC